MSFSKFDSAQEEMGRIAQEQSLFVARKNNADIQRQARDTEAQSEIDRLLNSVKQKKALDLAKKQKADYDAGIVDPDIAAKEAIEKRSALNKAAEEGMTDFEKYSQKNTYDLGNQEKAWKSANMYRMQEADQSNVAQKDRLVSQLDNQKSMQRATIDQANKLRQDDNQRAIDGFKLNI